MSNKQNDINPQAKKPAKSTKAKKSAKPSVSEEKSRLEAISDSFVHAMNEVLESRNKSREAIIKKYGNNVRFRRDVYDRLSEEGHWNAQWISQEYVKVVNKTSEQPAVVRDIILFIGDLASSYYKEHYKETVKETDKK